MAEARRLLANVGENGAMLHDLTHVISIRPTRPAKVSVEAQETSAASSADVTTDVDTRKRKRDDDDTWTAPQVFKNGFPSRKGARLKTDQNNEDISDQLTSEKLTIEKLMSQGSLRS
ncbi:hypothetical protein L1987_30397 [Smallanthus sonchifolius]|uniref:Uncharacterized protein n=1 Tax=Smallanthus sonchifolius TaxID=185202 RepID=A0ACB9I2H8_9ASTR|nr:hypothetical protein L1987_30397 [Smallanthus sonchifolius]